MPSARRPLSPRVYWRRRLLVVGTVAVVVLSGFLLIHMGPAPTEPVATIQSPTSTSTPSPTATPKKSGKKAKANKTPQATQTPQGPCDVSTLVVVPLVPESSPARTTVTIGLSFTTTASAPCTFEVTSDTVVARITRGGARVWSTQDCPDVVTDQLITVGPHTPGIASLKWNGRESSSGCPAHAKYLKPGNYLIQAAAYGSGAQQMKFELTAPPGPTATATPTATSTAKNGG